MRVGGLVPVARGGIPSHAKHLMQSSIKLIKPSSVTLPHPRCPRCPRSTVTTFDGLALHTLGLLTASVIPTQATGPATLKTETEYVFGLSLQGSTP